MMRMKLSVVLLLFLCQSIKCKLNTFKNVLFIVADDLGWADVGYEDDAVISPNIDKLAKNGIILNQTYTYSMCTPSRNSILSGVYAEHTGLQHSVILPEQPIGLPTSFTLLPEIFKEHGYKTHMIGKWHLGFCKKSFTPVNRGFDSFYGYLNAEENYYTHRVSANLIFKGSEGLDFWNQTADYMEPILDKNNTYSMFAFTNRATEILEQHDKDTPFFMYFSSQNCHLPNQVPKEYEDKYSYIEDESRRKYLGMVSVLDDSIGNITNKLEELGMLDNTLIFFTSDNGGAVYTSGRNYPLRGGKMTAFEGGHRVRAFINGPGLKPYVNEEMFHSVDWMPTVLNAALDVPLEISGIDGINQWPAITQNLKSNRTSFIYNIDPFGQLGCLLHATDAIREGDWKLIKGCPGIYDDWYPLPTFDKDFDNAFNEQFSQYGKTNLSESYVAENLNALYLFNIKEDPLEKKNLANDYPEIVQNLEAKLKEYKKTVVIPQNPPTLMPDEKANPKYWGDKWSPGWC